MSIIKILKILPYGLLMRLIRNGISPNYGKLILGKEYKVSALQIDEGEFVVFSQELQDIFDKRRQKEKEQRISKKLLKLNKALDKDYWLKEEFVKQIKEEIEAEKLEQEEGY